MVPLCVSVRFPKVLTTSSTSMKRIRPKHITTKDSESGLLQGLISYKALGSRLAEIRADSGAGDQACRTPCWWQKMQMGRFCPICLSQEDGDNQHQISTHSARHWALCKYSPFTADEDSEVRTGQVTCPKWDALGGWPGIWNQASDSKAELLSTALYQGSRSEGGAFSRRSFPLHRTHV